MTLLGQGLINILFHQIPNIGKYRKIGSWDPLKLVFLKETFMMFLDLAVLYKHQNLFFTIWVEFHTVSVVS